MMMRYLLVAIALLFSAFPALAQEEEEQAAVAESSEEETVVASQGDGIDSPKTLSGMSILGNEEAPKSLVIVPWKSSELGDDMDLSDTLDDRAKPVDKEVFLRELSYYEIRSGE